MKDQIFYRTFPRFILFFLILLSFFYFKPQTTSGDEDDKIQIFATIDKNKVSLGDRVVLTVSISSGKTINFEEPKLPSLSAFALLNTWESSEMQTSFIQGSFETRRTKKYSYLLKPKRHGILKIDPVRVIINGKTRKTKSIQIQVSSNLNPSSPPSSQTEDNEDDVFSGFFKSPFSPPSQAFSKNDFLVQVFVNKKEAYEGELILISWFIYTRGQIRDIDTLKYPSFKGFWKEDIEIATQLKLKKEILNGVIYEKALLASYALFPLSPGYSNIDPYQIKALLIRPSRFGFGRSYNVTKSSKPVKIKVLPLPKEGQPKGFNKAVGEFKVEATLDSYEVPAHQPVALKISFKGYGNAKLMDLPSTITFPASLEHYDTRSEAQFFKNGTSYKNFELILIPREEGNFKIPSFKMHAFSPKRKSYYTLSTPEIDLKVLPSKEKNLVPSLPLKEDLREKGESTEEKDKAKTLPSPILNWKEISSPSFLNVGLKFWLFAFALLFLFFILRFYFSFILKKKEENFKIVLSRRIQVLKKKIVKSAYREVGVEGTNLIYFILGEISGQGGAHLKIDELLNKTSPSLRNKIKNPIKDIMKKFELLSFAPQELIGTISEKSELIKLISDLEKMSNSAFREHLKKKNLKFTSESSQNWKKNFLLVFLLSNIFFSFSKKTESSPSKDTSTPHIESIEVSMDDDFPSPRWMYEEGDKNKIKNKEAKKLYLIKKNEKEEKYRACLKNLKNFNSEILRPWLRLTELKCARKWVLQSRDKGNKEKSSIRHLKEAFLSAKEEREKKKSGRKPKHFDEEYIQSLFTLIESEGERKKITQEFLNLMDEFQNLEEEMNAEQKSKMYFWLAFFSRKKHNLEAARDFLLKSLEKQDSLKVREELKETLQEIRKERRGLSSPPSYSHKDEKELKNKKFKNLKSNSLKIAFNKEKTLFRKMQRDSKKRRTLQAVKKGVQLLRLYPDGLKKDETINKIWTLAFPFFQSQRNEKKIFLRKQILGQMKKVRGTHLYEWAYKAYRMQLHKEASEFALESFKKLDKRGKTALTLKILSRSLFYLGDFRLAEFYFKKIAFEYAGSFESEEALFLLGLLKFKTKSYFLASDYFQHLLNSSKNFNLESYYWLWRTQQKLRSQKASQTAKKIVERYPLTYYGLRARAELNQGWFKWEKDPTSYNSKSHKSTPLNLNLWLTKNHKISWNRFKILLSAGWFEEAREELEFLSSSPQNPREKILWAWLWNLSFGHSEATSFFREAFNEDKNLLTISFLRLAYPMEFTSLIQRESLKNNVDPLLVRSLIKQESSYKVSAKSSANALGLMQLIPITAREQAQILKKKFHTHEDLFNPDLNISLGVHYLKRMIRAFNGHIPLALSAYNAGIGNIRKWRKNRKDLKLIENQLNSHYENETWIDEMPWSETRFYVKAILRNLLIYRMLLKKDFKWNPYFWVSKKDSKKRAS